MSKKIISTIKATIVLLIGILLPLGGGIYMVRLNSNDDVIRCVDSYISSESVNVAKYVGLQFEHTYSRIETMVREIESVHDIAKDYQELLKGFVTSEDGLISASLYNDKHALIGTSASKNIEEILSVEEIDNLKNEVKVLIDQLEDKSIIIRYITPVNVTMNGHKSKIFAEFVEKWNKYETFISRLGQGSFPRIYSIISPQAMRYLSVQTLSDSQADAGYRVAMGQHFRRAVDALPNQISYFVPENGIEIRTCKVKVAIPQAFKGFQLFVIGGVNTADFEAVSKALYQGIPNALLMAVCFWLIVALAGSRFYSRTKEKLEIANTISASTPLAVVIFNASTGKIMQINLSATTLFKLNPEDVSKVSMWNLFVSEDDRKYIKNTINSELQVVNYEVLAQSFSGSGFWAICSASPIEIEEELHVVLAVLDINRRKEIEKKLANNAELLERQVKERTADIELKAKELEASNEALEKAKSVADEANAAKSKFLTNMSNELKTPLNAIIGYSEILQEEALDRKDEVSATDLRKIIGAAKHLLSLINEILDLSKIESGKMVLFFENAEIINVIKDVEGVTIPLITEKDNSLFLEYSKNIGTIYTDTTKLRQCLLNLLSNAAKFTEFGRVTLRVAAVVIEGIDFVEFSIVDTGIGMSADKIKSIFDSFQESDVPNAGAGLGLSITKKYVEVLGGTIRVESEVGVGSKFTMLLPRVCKVQSSENIEVKNRKENVDDTDLLVQEDVAEIKSYKMQEEEKTVAVEAESKELEKEEQKPK